MKHFRSRRVRGLPAGGGARRLVQCFGGRITSPRWTAVGLAGVLILGHLAAGCTSKAKAEARAKAAYVAGQRQVLAQRLEAQRTTIRLVGNVIVPEIPWQEGMGVAEAIVAAGYRGRTNPQTIMLVRGGERFAIDPRALLRGEDVLLAPGDTIEIEP